MAFRIAVDAMGGDHAPEAVVEGAIQAVTSHDVHVMLVGDESRIRDCTGDILPDGITLLHTPDVIGMGESPTAALKQKPRASLAVAVQQHKSGDADAVISAGNTGAFFAASLLTLGQSRRPL